MCGIQVLFSPVRQHWLTVYGASKVVTVHDSLAGSASQRTQAAVRVLAGKRTRVKYSRTCTQQMPQSGDCGCFALAYATTLALGGIYCLILYITDETTYYITGLNSY